ncbi:pyrimidine utilization protein D, partial [Enterobacter hormaechei]|nr:pyrimidine utilization protein D [Enterobacter hormaechei]
ALVCVNGWLTLNPHTRRGLDFPERLLHAGGAQAGVEVQLLLLYPATWIGARAPRLEAEEALALAQVQGEANLLRSWDALRQAR